MVIEAGILPELVQILRRESPSTQSEGSIDLLSGVWLAAGNIVVDSDAARNAFLEYVDDFGSAFIEHVTTKMAPALHKEIVLFMSGALSFGVRLQEAFFTPAVLTALMNLPPSDLRGLRQLHSSVLEKYVLDDDHKDFFLQLGCEVPAWQC